MTMFETKRWGNGTCWSLWKWRALIEALQVPGRNIRSPKDKGVAVCVSQQFKDFFPSGLPEYLKGAFEKELTFDGCIDAAIELLRT